MLALAHRNFETADYLLSCNADPCIAASYGSCLHLAAQYGKVALADQLIRAGVDVNGYNQNDETPLFFAVGHYCGTATRETIDLLLACGARCDVTNSSDQPLLFNLADELYDYIPVFVQRGVDINHIDRTQNDALHYAIRNDRINSADEMINQEAPRERLYSK